MLKKVLMYQFHPEADFSSLYGLKKFFISWIDSCVKQETVEPGSLGAENISRFTLNLCCLKAKFHGFGRCRSHAARISKCKRPYFRVIIRDTYEGHERSTLFICEENKIGSHLRLRDL